MMMNYPQENVRWVGVLGDIFNVTFVWYISFLILKELLIAGMTCSEFPILAKGASLLNYFNYPAWHDLV